MSNKTTVGLAVVVVVIVIIAGLWYASFKAGRGLRYSPSPAVSTAAPVVEQTTPVIPTATLPAELSLNKVKIEITDAGFTPASITVGVGDLVVWHNSDSRDHQIASAPHPVHTDYPPLNLGVIGPGGEKSLMFDKAGTYKYHDHLNPNLKGTVVVK